jgi:phosphoinositide-3-kinase regulatory subunit 4
VLVSAKAAALHNTPPGFWNLGTATLSAKAALTRSADSTAPADETTSRQTGSKQTEKLVLQDKGFTAADEKKIIALKDFIVKQAHNAKA